MIVVIKARIILYFAASRLDLVFASNTRARVERALLCRHDTDACRVELREVVTVSRRALLKRFGEPRLVQTWQ